MAPPVDALPVEALPVDAVQADAAAEVDAAVAALPKKCAADSPVDDPCPTYGGTYRIKLTPRTGEQCIVKKAAEARIRISGANAYRGIGQATELAPLAKAIGKPNSDLRIGADVREGVCCIDLEISPKGMDAFVRVRIARGAKVANAKAKERKMTANNMCDAELDVVVERLGD